jgi:S1-C subfamily serine protease
MANQINVIAELSEAIAARTAAAKAAVTAIQVSHARHLTGTIWRTDLVVASEQSLPKLDKFAVVLPGGLESEAKLVGRDPGTNLALLRLVQPVALASAAHANPQIGGLVLAYGSDGAGGVTARMGIANLVGSEWYSQAGGRIDNRIVLDIRLAAAEEGGPVFDAGGTRLGISTFGPRKRALVIPAKTIDSVLPILLKDGRVVRGWLGAALRPVALSDPLQRQAGQSAGLMVLSVADSGPAAKAGVIPGDIVLSLDGMPATGVRKIVPKFDTDSIGRSADLRLIRGGTLVTLQAVIEARPAA